MNQVELNVTTRDTGKQAAKRIRNNGQIPGVYYIKGQEAISITANLKDLKPIVYTAQTKIIKLLVENAKEAKDCVLKKVDFDPVTDKIKHFDLFGILPEKKISIEVPIVLTGQSVGVKEGGVLQHITHKMPIRCLPVHIPDAITIDITNVKIGKSILLRNLSYDNIEFEMPGDTVIASVMVPRVAK